MSADVCPWCGGGSRHSDWGPYCSAGCEFGAVVAQARAEGEAAGYRRAIDEACALLDEEQLRAWATSVSPRLDGFADGVRHAMFEVRALAPVEPVSSADGLLGTAP